MSKEVTLVYQDCPYCAPREEWGKRQTKLAEDYGIKVRPMPFDAIGAKGLILKAQNRGASVLPFFTDGKKFGYDLSEFVKVCEDDKPTEADKAAAPKATTRKASAKRTVAEAEEKAEDEDLAEAE